MTAILFRAVLMDGRRIHLSLGRDCGYVFLSGKIMTGRIAVSILEWVQDLSRPGIGGEFVWIMHETEPSTGVRQGDQGRRQEAIEGCISLSKLFHSLVAQP